MTNKVTLTPMPETVINVKTKEEYDQLMEIYEAAGWRWIGGSNPKEQDSWEIFQEETCITLGAFSESTEGGFGYGRIGLFEKKGYKILSFQEFLKAQGPAEIKVNTYFDGRVKSLAVGPDITVGSILPGEYKFTASREEHMTITSGSVEFCEPSNKKEWVTVPTNLEFVVKPGSSFQIRCTVPVSYICIYGK